MKVYLFFIIVLIFIVVISGCVGQNPVTAIVDPCQNAFQDCNHRCGEGILAGVCKEQCTYDYNRCGRSR